MAAKRERINPGRGGARYVRRNKQGEFKEEVSVGRSISQDRKRKAKHTAKPGQGDRGDRKSTSARGSSRSSASKRGRTASKRGSGRKSR